MKRLNRDGPPAPSSAPLPVEVDAESLATHLAQGARVVDVRSTKEFGVEHIPGSINIPLAKTFATWAGSLIPYDRDIVLLADRRAAAAAAVAALTLIGLDRVVGWGGRGLRPAWRESGRAMSAVGHIAVDSLAARKDVAVIDVRAQTEWDEGHIPGARHFFLGNLIDLVRDLPRDTPIVTQCQGGSRSAIAASVLEAEGFTDVQNLSGGFGAWTKAGLPVER
jgi:hydroxyacylglutathione hydrolase